VDVAYSLFSIKRFVADVYLVSFNSMNAIISYPNITDVRGERKGHTWQGDRLSSENEYWQSQSIQAA
jgi:hypothetical protein